MGPENFFFDFVTTQSYGEGQVVGWFAKKTKEPKRAAPVNASLTQNTTGKQGFMLCAF